MIPLNTNYCYQNIFLKKKYPLVLFLRGSVFSICGGGNLKSVHQYADRVAFWVFLVGHDDLLNPYYLFSMVTALQKSGVDVKLTYFECENHNSWDATFSQTDLLP